MNRNGEFKKRKRDFLDKAFDRVYGRTPAQPNFNRQTRIRRGTNNRSTIKTGGARSSAPKNAPVAQGFSIMRMPSRLDNMTFRHTEMIGSLYSVAEVFSANSVNVNPGLPQCFPWLSRVASMWELYNVRQMTIKYVPAVATSLSGSIFLAFDYDALDAAPSDLSNVLQCQEACTSPVWAACDISLKTQSLQRRKNLYTRSGSVSSSDLKTYDVGRLFYGCQGLANADVLLGHLMIEYDIVLSVPQPPLPFLQSYIQAPGVSGQTGDTPFGSGGIERLSNHVGVMSSATTWNLFTVNVTGEYLVNVFYEGTGLEIDPGDNGIADPSTFPDDTVVYMSQVLGGTGGDTRVNYVYHAHLTEGSALKLLLSTATTVTQATFVILPSNLLTT